MVIVKNYCKFVLFLFLLCYVSIMGKNCSNKQEMLWKVVVIECKKSKHKTMYKVYINKTCLIKENHV